MAFASRKRTYAFIIIAALFVAASLLPWKIWLEARLKMMLEAQGLHNVQLSIAHVGLSSIQLENIAIGAETPMVLENVALGYRLTDLYAGQLRDLTISGLTVQAQQKNAQWGIVGLESWQTNVAAKSPLSIPATTEQLTNIAFNELQLDKSNLHVAADKWQLDLPLAFQFQKYPQPQINYHGDGLNFRFQKIAVTSGPLTAVADLKGDAKQWEGSWQINDVNVTGIENMPTMSGHGTLSAQQDRIHFDGQLISADKGYSINFKTRYFLNDQSKSELILADAAMPWGSGVIIARNVVVPFADDPIIKVNLEVQRVTLDTIIKLIAGDKTTATGTLSGTLPITFRNGTITDIADGQLTSAGAGIISMPPDVIPGDNPQIILMRDILKNFHYKALAIEVLNKGNHKISVRLKLDGSNPDVYEGKQIKLNVQLAGDMLKLVQQNIMSLTNPGKLMEQGDNAN